MCYPEPGNPRTFLNICHHTKIRFTRTILIVLLLPIIIMLLPATLEAQRQAARGLIINPLLDDRHHLPDNKAQSFNTFGGWAGFGYFALSSDDHHLWYQDLGGYVELWRQGSTASLLLTGQIQFIADPHNDINFNPRAIFWEEGLLYTNHLNPGYLQIGFMHRCKHDIDNLERGEERSLIFSSMIVRYQQPASLFRTNDIMLMAGFDQYVITWDRRKSRELEAYAPDWNDLSNEFTLQAHWRENPSVSGIFLESRLHVVNLDGNLRLNRGVSTGWYFHRSGGDFRIALHYEYLHDSGVPAVPADVHLISVGIRANSAFVVW